MFWASLEEFADCERTLLESANSADSLSEMIASLGKR